MIGRTKIARWIGVLLLLAIVAILFGPSIRYRLAVGDLHDQLADIQPSSGELIDSYVSSCYDVAPASIRVYRPTGGADLAVVRSDYISALSARGFESIRLGLQLAWGRERNDDLDGDDVRFVADEGANTLTVIADAYDTDMVTCIPLTGRR